MSTAMCAQEPADCILLLSSRPLVLKYSTLHTASFRNYTMKECQEKGEKLRIRKSGGGALNMPDGTIAAVVLHRAYTVFLPLTVSFDGCSLIMHDNLQQSLPSKLRLTLALATHDPNLSLSLSLFLCSSTCPRPSLALAYVVSFRA